MHARYMHNVIRDAKLVSNGVTDWAGGILHIQILMA